MAARIEIEVREINGPWFNVLIQVKEEIHVVRVVPPHDLPRFFVPTHTPEPEMFPGMWELTPDTKISAGRIKLIAIKLKVFSQNFEGVNRSVGWWRLKLVIDKAGVGLFEVEGITIMSNGDITLTEKFVEVLNERAIVLEALLIPGIVREGANSYRPLVRPAIGKR